MEQAILEKILETPQSRAMRYATRKVKEYGKLSEETEHFLWMRFKEAYKAGAEEQKAIDDEERKRVHKGVLDKAIKEKKELIDKACEWLKGWFVDSKYYTPQEALESLRKYMEKEV